ncbi:MAG TPA: TIGR03435 family protein [Acidobacteriaceae bacterium]|jgi:uncharacterized protein (TIGR03435 family)|nr:TIGR03435 family protein [Acidobacteriaceae bacterium]
MFPLLGLSKVRREGPFRRSSAWACGDRVAPAKCDLAFVFGLAILIAVPAAHAQLVQLDSGEPLPSFEVAAIRPNNSASGREQIWHNDNSYRVENLSLRELIRNAWGATSNSQLIGGPDALLAQHFDLDAKISDADTARLSKLPRAESNRQVDLMMQDLLTDRLNLKVHIETRSLPVFVLAAAKSGVKFHASVPVQSAIAGKPPEMHTSFTLRMDKNGADMVVTNRTLDTLTKMLATQSETEGRPVVDKTGLSGTFDFSLKWTPEYMSASIKVADNLAISSADTASGSSLFTALQDQLGLKLESEKAPTEVIVIDHVEPPSAN